MPPLFKCPFLIKKVKKPIFGLFPQFSGQQKFFQKIRLCYAQPDEGFQYHTEIQRNLMIQFQETPRQTTGWTDPILQDPFSYSNGPNKYNCSRLTFKSLRHCVQCQYNQKFLNHSMQKISSIHKFTLKIQQILGSYKLNGHIHF